MSVLKVISGAQTGVDRAALDAAIELGISHGGWVPKVRLAEIGPVPAKYRVQELPSSNYQARTKKNIETATATLIFVPEQVSKGTSLTIKYAEASKKPFLLVKLNSLDDPATKEKVIKWLGKLSMATVNIAGPRESSNESYSAYGLTLPFIKAVLEKS